MEGSQGPVTLCDEDGVLQVGEQRVLIVTLVPEKHQETGERERARLSSTDPVTHGEAWPATPFPRGKPRFARKTLELEVGACQYQVGVVWDTKDGMAMALLGAHAQGRRGTGHDLHGLCQVPSTEAKPCASMRPPGWPVSEAPGHGQPPQKAQTDIPRGRRWSS